jgi:hypothetical protein
MERKMSRRELNGYRARLLCALWELTEINPYHGLTTEEVVEEMLCAMQDIESGECPEAEVAMWWDSEWNGEAELEQKWENALEAAVELAEAVNGRPMLTT